MRCASAGFIFIGPKGDVHRLMGDRRLARQVQKIAVPVVPGYDGEDQSDARPRRGGFADRLSSDQALARRRGKGIHVTNSAAEFEEAVLPRAQAESLSSFGSDFLVTSGGTFSSPADVEVQVLFDQHGRALPLRARVLGA